MLDETVRAIRRLTRLAAGATLVVLAASAARAAEPADPYPSTYVAAATPALLIRGATLLTGNGTRLDNADVLVVDGRVAAVGHALAQP
ncbi:MAG: amidohydrolase, partial [Proteobacteria bacterium]|nr:amidohydrolase [Pseudomonadota bacterium]